MTAPHIGGQVQSGKNMAEQISQYKKRRSIRQELTFPVSKAELWEMISRPGNLNECHPLCRTNEALEWQEGSHQDRLVYLNGRTYVRQFINWNIGEGYDLIIGEVDGPQSYVVWELSEQGENTSSLSITVYPYLLENLNPVLSYLPFILYIKPKLSTYLKSVVKGFAYYAEHKQAVPRNHWGRHSWFS